MIEDLPTGELRVEDPSYNSYKPIAMSKVDSEKYSLLASLNPIMYLFGHHETSSVESCEDGDHARTFVGLPRLILTVLFSLIILSGSGAAFMSIGSSILHALGFITISNKSAALIGAVGIPVLNFCNILAVALIWVITQSLWCTSLTVFLPVLSLIFIGPIGVAILHHFELELQISVKQALGLSGVHGVMMCIFGTEIALLKYLPQIM